MILTFYVATILLAHHQVFTLDTSIGYGFYLPNHDLLGEFQNGAKIFSEIKESDCIVTIANQKHRRDVSYYEDVYKFMTVVTVRTGLGDDVKGRVAMKDTLDAKTTLTTGEFKSSGSSLFMYAYKEDKVFSSQCKNQLKLDDGFVAAFESLPGVVQDPFKKENWVKYDDFLKKFGSHFVSRAKYGAYFEQWNFAKLKLYTQQEFEARSCADVLGPNDVKKLNVTACSNKDPKIIENSQQFNMTSTVNVFGGSEVAREALKKERTEKTIVDFLNSAPKSSAPVGYHFTEIWDVLQSRYLSTPHYAKALNLKYYFKGFVMTDCNHVIDGLTVLRRFVEAEDYQPRRPSYKCEIPARGCRQNADCHIGKSAVRCFCYGPGCVDYNDEVAKDKSTATAFIKKEDDDQAFNLGVNNSCYYKMVWGSLCKCKQSWGGGWTSVWSSENSNRRK